MPALPTSARRARVAVACLAIALVPALLSVSVPAAGAAPPTYRGASADGEVVFFETEEQLVPGDTDNKRDIYERSFDAAVGDEGAYVTREVSTGPTGGNDAYNALFELASGDGSKAFFSTDESLVAADKDRETDVYVRDLLTGTTRLVSIGAPPCQPGCGNGSFDAGVAGVAMEGDWAFVVTAERLDPSADTDAANDVYLRDLAAETTTLISAGGASCAPACGNGNLNATLRGLSGDGSRAFFTTFESLVLADSDGAIDVYARDLPGGPTALVSVGDPGCSPCGNDPDRDAIFAGSSDDGSRVFFSSAEGLVPGDLDGANDIYQRTETTTTRISGGTEPEPASFKAVSADGSRAFFVTVEPLAGGEDANGSNDVYMWEGGAPQLITSGNCCDSTFGAVVDDAETVVFTTEEALDPADTDGSADVYEQDVAGGAPVLVSAGAASCAPACGNGVAPARFNHSSVDGLRVFFTSDEALTGQDFDSDDDIYARDVAGGATTLSSPPPGLCPVDSCDATFVAASADASHVFFQTSERLVPEDVDSEADIYERGFDVGLGADATRLVSTGNSPDLELGPPPPLLTGTAPGSPGSSTQPLILGQARAQSAIKIYPTSSCSGEPVATGTAEQLAAPGLAVTVTAGSTTSFWATAEAEGFTSLCSSPISYAQQEPSSPAPGAGGSGGGAAAGGSAPRPPIKTHDGIAYVAPLARITFGPSAKTRARRPVFRFADFTGQPGTRFTCKLDRGPWKACGSPTRLKPLSRGRHVFSVTAVNAVGTPALRPASRAFRLVSR